MSAVLLALAAPAEARIGESEEQCSKRYGKVARHEHPDWPYQDCCVYETGRLVVKAYLISGRCQGLLIHTVDKSPFSEEELKVVMNANSNGATWKELRPLYKTREFKRSDDRASMIVADGRSLLIESAEAKAAHSGMSKF